jgi:medium-chain acyl-[acyl-carrier-protein] hydrolase
MDTVPLVWKEQRAVESYEIDMFGQLRPHVFFGYLLNSAWSHTRGTPYDYRSLSDRNQIWVLAKLQMEIRRPPRWGEQISIETWSKGTDRFYALRDFIIRSSEGEKIASATTAWMVLDKDSYRPQKLESMKDDFPSEPGKVEMQTNLKKVQELEGGADRARFDVHFSDIDVNNHVTATKYLQWMLDSYPLEQHVKKSLKTIEISFVAEAVMGDHVTVWIESLPDRDLLAVRRSTDTKDLCRAVLGWLPV